MAITKEQKTAILQDLVDKFGRSKSVVFSDYRGLDVASVSDLRNRLREKGAETKVAKKTLIKLASKESNIGELGDDIMEGPVSATFSYEDDMAGLKVLFKFSKENENLKLLGGIINGEVVGADEIIQLAKLPGREELLAKFIGSVNAPVSGFVGTLSNLVGGFVRVLNAYKDSLPAEPSSAKVPEAPEAPKEEKPKEEVKADEPTPEAESETQKEKAEELTETSEETAESSGDTEGADLSRKIEGSNPRPEDEGAEEEKAPDKEPEGEEAEESSPAEEGGEEERAA